MTLKIIHVAPNAPYEEGWSYQENLLPKYQAKLGHQVILAVSTERHTEPKHGNCSFEDYQSADGFRVIRQPIHLHPLPFLRRVLKSLDVYELFCSEKPDMIFHHGLISPTICQAVRYKKKVNPECVIIQDNHMDYNIGFTTDHLKGRLLKCIYSRLYRSVDPYITRVYGVTPWRKLYAEAIFGVPKSKTDVLIMGADDDRLDFAHRDALRAEHRQRFNVQDDEFLIVTGGKIDAKKKIHLLMDAVKDLPKVKLLICGSATDDFASEYQKHFNPNVIDAGWISSEEFYGYFFAADLVFFPGQHSVLWEQACASKVPCVFGKWDGMEHVNNGGNAQFLHCDDPVKIRELIQKLQFTDEYQKMLRVAQSEKTDIYLYSRIAEKSLECAIQK
jgi:glycosyltransferase involved in cell wall biosynthesis